MCFVFPKIVTCKKRKYKDKNRGFRQEWEETLAFIDRVGKSLCLTYHAVLNHSIFGNLKRHYDTNNGHFHRGHLPKSEICPHKIKSLKCSAQ